jgi:UDP-N-acetylmuramate: L-alanyl-gamma-D-glutamyl-meso-diaminopimelate ligase
MKEYNGALEKADEAAVFYSKHALELKRMPELSAESIKKGFAKENLEVFNERKDLEEWLQNRDFENTIVVFMSSGNYDGIETENFAKRITGVAE